MVDHVSSVNNSLSLEHFDHKTCQLSILMFLDIRHDEEALDTFKRNSKYQLHELLQTKN